MPEEPAGATYGPYIPQSAFYKRNRTKVIKARRKTERQNKRKARA